MCLARVPFRWGGHPCGTGRSAALLVAVLAGVVGCDGGTAPAPVPAQLQIVTGDGQEVLIPGHTVEALVVRVVDLDGRPVPEVPVAWTAAQGALEGTPATDADGLASASWFVDFVGNGLATAAVEGLVPVHFSASGRYPSIGLADLELVPGAVDVSTGPAQVVVTARAYSEVQVGDVMVRLTAPDGTSITLFLSLVEGSPEDGTWSGTVEIPHGAATGDWTIRVTVAGPSEAGCQCLGYPRVLYPPAALGYHGFPSHVEVSNSP